MAGLRQPLLATRGEPGHDGCKPLKIERFLELLKQEEDYWEGEQSNTRLMVTKLRKIFYDEWGWDKLIPKAAGIESRYKVDIVNAPEEGVEQMIKQGAKKIRWQKNNPYQTPVRQVTYRADDRKYKDSREGETPDIYACHHQEVLLPDGCYCDIAHTLAGLDALNHREAVGPVPWLIKILPKFPHVDSNADIVTWLGDIASSSADFLFAYLENDEVPLHTEQEQQIIEGDAPGSDMLGNIDAFVIATHYKTNTGQGQRMTDILKDYYLGSTGTPPYRNHRFSCYCEAVGLEWNGEHFSNESQWLKNYRKQLRDNICFQVYSLIDLDWKNKKLFWNNLKLLLQIWFNRYEEVLKKGTLLKIWLDALKEHIIKYEQNGDLVQPLPRKIETELPSEIVVQTLERKYYPTGVKRTE